MAEVTRLCVVCPTLRTLCPPDCEKHAEQKECRRARRTDGALACDPCRRQVTSDLRELPELYAAAFTNRLPGKRGGGQPMSPEFESRLPGSTEILNIVGPGTMPAHLTPQGKASADLQHGQLPPTVVLLSWLRNWTDARGQHEKGPRTLTLTSVVHWLYLRLDWAFSNYPAVDEFARQINEQARHLRTVAGRNRLTHRLAAPCPTCSKSDLQRDDGDTWIRCGNCGRLWSEVEAERLTVVVASELERTEPGPEVLSVTDRNTDLWDRHPKRKGRWVKRGKPHVVRSWTDLLMDVAPLTPVVDENSGSEAA